MSFLPIEKNKELSIWEASAVSFHVNLSTRNFTENNPFLPCLEAGFHSIYVRYLDFKYNLSWVVAAPVVADCYCPGFISRKKKKKGEDGKHAENILIENYKYSLEEISETLISYSPYYAKCTPKIITAFDNCRIKPASKFHCVHGRCIEDSLKRIDELKAAGFSVGISDYKHYAKHQINTAPTLDLRDNFIRRLEINEKALNTRRKEIMESLLYSRYAGLESM